MRSQALEHALSEEREQRANEKEALRTKLEMLRKSMTSRADNEGALAALHIENSRLHQRVQELETAVRSVRGSSDESDGKARRQCDQLKLQLERVRCGCVDVP